MSSLERLRTTLTLGTLTALLFAPLAGRHAADQTGTNLITAPTGSKPQPVSETALRWQRPVGAPRHSDVSFSIRWMRKEVDPFEKIAAFHGTRFDWVYATKEFIGQCAQRGYPICHCTSPCWQDRCPGEGSASATYKIGRAEGLRGQPLTASWQNWSPPWGCYSNPDFFRLMEQDVN